MELNLILCNFHKKNCGIKRLIQNFLFVFFKYYSITSLNFFFISYHLRFKTFGVFSKVLIMFFCMLFTHICASLHTVMLYTHALYFVAINKL